MLKKVSRELTKQTIKDMAVDYLGINDVDVQNKEEENSNARDFIYELLKMWKSKNQDNATVEALRKIFKRASKKMVVPAEVYNILTD